MAAQKSAANRAASAGPHQQRTLSLIEALSLAESSIETMRKAIDPLNSEIYREFREIAQEIARAKSDIGGLQANDIRTQKIPEAGRELNAVVDATEEATHRIMECAETIMTADPSNPATYHNVVTENVMAIFEACSFQDITGQRISRVVDTLEHIDKRVSKFAERIGVDDQDLGLTIDDEEQKRGQRKKDLLLHGPQDESTAVSQDEIDRLLNT